MSKTEARLPTERRRADPQCLYIHGFGSHPPVKVWKSQWDLALFGRPMGKRTKGAYWANILNAESDARRAKASDTRSTRISVESILKEARLNKGNDRAAEFVARLMAQLHLAGEDAMEGVSSRATPVPGQWRRRIGDAFLGRFVKDAAAYFFDSDVRRRIKERLIHRIAKADAPLVLVSHSMGTIIAYEVLSQLTSEQPRIVSQFVTLGSPLGIREIQDQLTRDGVPIDVPSAIASWHDFADRLDPIASDNRLANEFLPTSNDFGLIQDHRIINNSSWDFSKFDPHDSAGYLSHPDVRAIVHQEMRFDSAGRFVIARDVAHGFAARHVRQPVLIEVLESNYPAVDETHDEMVNREARQRERNNRIKSLAGRIKYLAKKVKSVVEDHADDDDSEDALRAARVLKLRKYVSAHLTPTEIQALATNHADLNIYAMWRSSSKRKLIHRSHRTIGADAARASFKSMGKGIVWAVLDTGCRFDHPHFRHRRGKGSASYDDSLVIDVLDCTTTSQFPESIADAAGSDPDGHGTHVSGIITGSGRVKQVLYEGVAPKTRLLVYKVLDDHGVGEDAWIVKAIDDIFRRNEDNSHIAVHGVNLSLGGPFDATVYGCGFSPICKELRDLWRQGTLVCVAAGNEGQIQISTQDGRVDLNTSMSIGDPANLEDCIAVGSVNTDKPYLLWNLAFLIARSDDRRTRQARRRRARRAD